MSSTVTVIGPGSIGGALAGGLVVAGHDPQLVARTPFDSLQVSWPDGEIAHPVSCVSDPDDVEPTDIVIVATKATQNADITDHVRAATRPGSILVIAQNGVDHRDRFPDLDDGVIVVPAVVMLPAKRLAPGNISLGKPSRLTIPAGPGAVEVEAVFAGSFITIDISDDWTSAAWFKLILNAASGALGVLTRRGPDIYADPEAQELLLTLMEEVAMVGRAEGADLAADMPTNLQQYMIERSGGHTPSITVDRLAGNPTEWRERNEVVVRVAERHGLDVPVSRMLTTLMRLGEPEGNRD